MCPCQTGRWARFARRLRVYVVFTAGCYRLARERNLPAMKMNIAALMSASLLGMIAASPVVAQEAGDAYVRVAAARTKLVDKGDVKTNGVLDPAAGYSTRETFHGVVTGGYYIANSIAVEASISTPATTDNLPAGSLLGTPNLGDDEFTMATLGVSLHPFRGKFQPYVGGGIIRHFTTQERDGLGVGLNIPNAYGPYVHAGVDVAMSRTWGLFADVRKAFYHTNATGLLPLDATYTQFASVDAKAELDPLTIQLGVVARFGRGAAAESDTRIETDTTKWVLRGGLTSLTLADKVALSVGGAVYPGAGLSTYEHQTPSIQIGRYLTQNIAVNATLGFPPTIDIRGAGTAISETRRGAAGTSILRRKSVVATGRCDAATARPIRNIGVAIALFQAESDELARHVVERDGAVVHLRAITRVLGKVRSSAEGA